MMVATKSIKNSRLMRFQSFNAYRKRFNMKPYASFEEMTGEKEIHLCLMLTHDSEEVFIQNFPSNHLETWKTVYLHYKEIYATLE